MAGGAATARAVDGRPFASQPGRGEGPARQVQRSTSSSCADLIGGDVVGVISLKKVAVRATATTAAAGSADIVVCVGFGGDQA